MVIKFVLLFIGIIEEAIAILYYRMGQKDHRFTCMCLSGIRVLIWSFVTYNIFKHIDNIWTVVLPYCIGAMLGNFLSLKFEPLIDKKILKIKRKRGRRKKKWFMWNFKNE